MHTEVRIFVKEVKNKYPSKFRLKNVLEVGSQNINGSVREYFLLCEYTGIDITPGIGVNKVGRLSDIKDELQPFYDTVISTEALEHDATYSESLKIMYDKLPIGGLLIITCAGPHREEHGTTRAMPELSPGTNNHYHNISTEEFESLLPSYLFSTYVLQYVRGKSDLQFYGIKK